MAQINAYITFNGNCREAMTFYKACFGGELTLQTVDGTPPEDRCPDGSPKQIMHAMLMNNELVLMGTDMRLNNEFIRGNTIAMALYCNSEQEIRKFFHCLSENGQVTEPLAHKPWGALFGCLIDPYGIFWMLSFDERSQ
jgi:PhnB protein